MSDITKIKVNGEPESRYQLYPRNEEFAKRAGGGNGGFNVQPDWNQSDETAPDYVKNRPFYKDVKILDSIDVDISWDGDTTGKTASSQNRFYKVSDSTFTKEQFLQMYFICNGSEIAMSSPDVLNSNSKVLSYMDGGGPVIAVDIGGNIQGGPPDVFPETGVYFPSDGSVTRLFSKESILSTEIVLKKIDEEFIPDNVLHLKNEINNKLDSRNPNAFGSFSMGRKYPSVIGENSYAAGLTTIASGNASHAEGKDTTASGGNSHAEGNKTTASGGNSHAEGNSTTASGNNSHSEGWNTTAYGISSHAEGVGTKALSDSQHVQGKYNIEDPINTYAHIVGNGSSESFPSNAHTLSWSGDPWFKGRPQFGGTAQDQNSQTVMANGDKEIILASSSSGSTKKFRITVDDSGAITATEVT